jgi:hypothetical protein
VPQEDDSETPKATKKQPQEAQTLKKEQKQKIDEISEDDQDVTDDREDQDVTDERETKETKEDAQSDSFLVRFVVNKATELLEERYPQLADDKDMLAKFVTEFLSDYKKQN